MDEVTTMPSDDVPAIQHIVQRKLGRCLLRLQQYERQLKVIAAHGELSGPADRLHTIREQKIACAQKKTMGMLVGMLTESFLTLPLPNEENHRRKPIPVTRSGSAIDTSWKCQPSTMKQ